MPTKEPVWVSLDPYVRTFKSWVSIEKFSLWGPWYRRPLARVGRLSVHHVRTAGNEAPFPKSMDGKRISDNYRVLLLVYGGVLIRGEYVEAPGALVYPPGVHEGAEVIEPAEAIFVALGPEGKHDPMARLFVPLLDSGVTIKLKPSVSSMVKRPDQMQTLSSLGKRRDVLTQIHAYAKAKPGHDFSHQHRTGGELLLVLDGEISDGRETVGPMMLCVHGPLTKHDPRPLTNTAALTLTLGQPN